MAIIKRTWMPFLGLLLLGAVIESKKHHTSISTSSVDVTTEFAQDMLSTTSIPLSSTSETTTTTVASEQTITDSGAIEQPTTDSGTTEQPTTDSGATEPPTTDSGATEQPEEVISSTESSTDSIPATSTTLSSTESITTNPDQSTTTSTTPAPEAVAATAYTSTTQLPSTESIGANISTPENTQVDNATDAITPNNSTTAKVQNNTNDAASTVSAENSTLADNATTVVAEAVEANTTNMAGTDFPEVSTLNTEETPESTPESTDALTTENLISVTDSDTPVNESSAITSEVTTVEEQFTTSPSYNEETTYEEDTGPSENPSTTTLLDYIFTSTVGYNTESSELPSWYDDYESSTEQSSVLDQVTAEHTTALPGGAGDSEGMSSAENSIGMTAGLILAVLFGCVLCVTVLALIGRSCYNSWQKRHYTRMDYLINAREEGWKFIASPQQYGLAEEREKLT